jgi:hypothetical protein
MDFSLEEWIGLGTELCPICGLAFTPDLFPVIGKCVAIHCASIYIDTTW